MKNRYRHNFGGGGILGFTLAEVLITLGIIGVVAALTLPNLISNYQKHQTVVQLKRIYSQLSNAVVESELVNSEYSTWDMTLSAQNFFIKYFKDFLPVIKECRVATKDRCSSVTQRLPLKNSTDTIPLMRNNGGQYSLVLNNGTIIFMDRHENMGVVYLFSVDLNGDKGPNRNGRDVFHFAFTKDGLHGYSHYGFNHKARYNMSGAYGSCNKNSCCSFARAGGGCSTMIMYDGWQIKDDYPW